MSKKGKKKLRKKRKLLDEKISDAFSDLLPWIKNEVLAEVKNHVNELSWRYETATNGRLVTLDARITGLTTLIENELVAKATKRRAV